MPAQTPQLVSAFELLLKPISPLPIPTPLVVPKPVDDFTGNGNSAANGGSHGAGISAVIPPTLSIAQPLYGEVGPLSKIIEELRLKLGTEPSGAIKPPTAIQGYFLWITNLGTAPLTPVVTVKADSNATTILTKVSDPNNPLTASVLAITDVGNGVNNIRFLKLVNGVPTLTLLPIPASATALFALVGNYALFSDVTEANLELRGSLSIAIDKGSAAKFAPVLLTPQIRSTFVSPGVPAPAESATALPTASGAARYVLPGPAFTIRSALNGFALDAAGPIVQSSGVSTSRLVVNPVNGSPTQLWYLAPDGFIVNAANEYVIQAQSHEIAPFVPAVVNPRTASFPVASQIWSILTSLPFIRFGVSNIVLEVFNGGTAPGTPVQLALQVPNVSQLWVALPATV